MARVKIGNVKGPKGDPGEKGDPGATGNTPNISATASIDDGVGVPSVVVSNGGTQENPVIDFEFHNLKGSGGGAEVIKIAHSDLLSLRNAANLAPGTWYRITDYVTTTSQAESQSANHPFDVIVLAIDKNKLDENAFAIQHEGDTYFANSKLEAWKLKYCIDNDTARFVWASGSGKGVIYELIDEFENKCAYDFKNIQFKRYKVTKCDKCTDLVNGYYGVRAITGSTLYPSGATISSTDTVWRYTFDAAGTDASLRGHSSQNTSGDTYGCYGNEIFPYYRTTGAHKLTQYLNNVVFLNSSATSYQCYRNRLVGAKIYSSTFGNYCYSNTFGNNCYSNTFGNYCYSNTFGNYCYYNTFGNNCYSNTFGNYCYSNTFGNYCNSNTFGNNCYSNTFGNYCYSNTFGNYCYYNTFGNYCYSNTFGNYCYYNTFGNNCYSNTFGNYCNSMRPLAFIPEWQTDDNDNFEYSYLRTKNETGYQVTVTGTLNGSSINKTIAIGAEVVLAEGEDYYEGTLRYTLKEHQIEVEIGEGW